MYKRFLGIFEYCAFHLLAVGVPARRIEDCDRVLLGYVEDLHVSRGSIHLRGWTVAETLEVRLGDRHWTRTPTLERGDVAAALQCDPRVGFEMRLPDSAAREMTIGFTSGGRRTDVSVELPGPAAIARARRRLWRHVMWQLFRRSPMIVAGLLRRDPDLRRRLKIELGLVETGSPAMLDAAALAETDVPAPMSGVSVVVPVHDAFDLTQDCLRRIIANTDIPWRLLIVEDASRDPRVRPWLRDWVSRCQAAGHDIHLMENAENLGFIGSVNKGLAAALEFDDPVVLINSDALVPSGWASRLLAPIWRDPGRVATVTPMSNDAEIFTVPVVCVPTSLDCGQADAIDAAARRLPQTEPAMSAPTGVGFCMALNNAFLRRLPALDTAFGRGYGEEVDWCRKAAALGGRHVAATTLFVEHRGGQSFGTSEKKRLVAKNNAEITRRYPDFDASVQRFIAEDPLVTVRMRLALAYLDSMREVSEVPVFVAHAMGGGAENYLGKRLEALSSPAAVVLRFGGATRCRMEVVTPGGWTQGHTDDLDLVERLIRSLTRRRIVYSCAVGDPDPIALPDFMVRLAQGCPLEILLHDFFPLSPSYTLLDSDNVYRGVPAPGRGDPAHRSRRSDGTPVTLGDWRASWGAAIACAARLVVFSNDSRRLVSEAYPEAAARIAVQPHALLHPVPRVDVPQRKRLVIGVLGNIGPHKGAGVVQAVSRMLRDARDAELIVLGRVAPTFRLADGTVCHGAYAHDEIPALVRHYGINTWFIPSIWPETFSYTTHECLATGLPVIAFDLGAQGEAVRRAPNGRVVPIDGAGSVPSQLAERIVTAARSLWLAGHRVPVHALADRLVAGHER